MGRASLICVLFVCAFADVAHADTTAVLKISEPRISGVPITFDASGSTVSPGATPGYSWDFNGDNVFAPGDAVEHRAFDPGSHVVGLEVVSRFGDFVESTDDVTATIVVVNGPPSAGFTFEPPSPLTGQPVSFSSTSSDPDGIPAGDQTWDIDGDGRFDDGAGVDAAYRFRHPGSYVVRLRVEDRFGAVAVAERSVTVGNRPPVADFAVFPRSPKAGEAVELTSTSSDPDGALATIRWDLDGDGAYDDAGGATASSVFWTPGRHRVGVEVTDGDGASAAATRAIRVEALPAGRRAARFLSPWPTVRIAGRTFASGARITRLAVTAPGGSWIDARCRGDRCPRSRIKRRVPGGRETSVVRLRRLERTLAAGARVAIRIGKAQLIGRYVRFDIRRNRPPRRTDRCLPPGKQTPVRCRTL